MKLYTIQRETAWRELKTSGFLSPEEPLVDKDFIHAYKWMMSQMTSRLPNFSGRYPVWAWVKRPDLRLERSNYKGRQVLIEFEEDEKKAKATISLRFPVERRKVVYYQQPSEVTSSVHEFKSTFEKLSSLEEIKKGG